MYRGRYTHPARDAGSLSELHPAQRGRKGRDDKIRSAIRTPVSLGASMADPRIEKLARVMVNYSLELKPGHKLWLRTTPLAEELNLAVYEEAIKAGAHVFIDQRMPGSEEIFFKYASPEQLDYVSPLREIVVDTFDAE